MFVQAIETASEFTRPIYLILRYYGSSEVYPGTATLFFVNDQGWALTCWHVIETILAGDQLALRRKAFQAELAAVRGKAKERRLLRSLEEKYQLTSKSVIELKSMFVGCVEGNLEFECIRHPSLDVALVHFKNYTRLLCEAFPRFAANPGDLKQGKFLCRLGFPFPEFANYEYSTATDSIEWTNSGRAATPRFPIEGMVTRHLIDAQGSAVGLEMSTPGLKGQSGGPVFDREGRVWGIQSRTQHLDLDFDINQEVVREGKKKRVTDSAFLHVGHCLHVDVLKSFMRSQNVPFSEG